MDRTYIKIDLDNLNYNIDNIKNKIDNRAKLLVVIKANAYGHGAVQVAKEIQNKCDFFGVACIEEALELINAGIKTPILILGYVSPEFYEVVVKNNIRIPVFSYEVAKALSKEAVKQQKIVDFHFALDTGMSRIGFQCCEKDADVCKKICELENINAEGIFSHFATADEENLDKTLNQKQKFKDFIKMLEDRNINIPIKHINNSAGIINFDEYFDMVRSGIITYGMYPSEDVPKTIPIKPVMSWHAMVSHVKELEKGREISYGGTYVTNEKRIIATIPVGYADGYPRCLSNIGKVLINGQEANIVGRVCMDQFMVDVTDIKNVGVETPVVLVGKDKDKEITMEEFSQKAYSFNYEIPCRISHRVTRKFFKNSNVVESVNYLL